MIRGGAVTGLAAVLALLVTGCDRDAHESRADPLMDVFLAQAQEEGLSRVETDGKRLFEHYCSTCHGERGLGDGQNAFNLDPPPPSFPEALTQHSPDYWRQIIEGGTSAVGRSPLCPPWGQTLTAEQIDALVAFLPHLAATEPSVP